MNLSHVCINACIKGVSQDVCHVFFCVKACQRLCAVLCAMYVLCVVYLDGGVGLGGEDVYD
jgi:hypothetical protein